VALRCAMFAVSGPSSRATILSSMSTESIMRSVCWLSTRVRFWEVTVARSMARSRAFQLANPAEPISPAQAKATASQIRIGSGGLRSDAPGGVPPRTALGISPPHRWPSAWRASGIPASLGW
jgi:hypothetical protein